MRVRIFQGTHGGLINPLPPRDSNTELQMKELKEQYDRLKQDFNNKMLTVASLRAQNDKLMEITDKAREERDFCEEQCKSLEKRLKQLETEKTKVPTTSSNNLSLSNDHLQLK